MKTLWIILIYIAVIIASILLGAISWPIQFIGVGLLHFWGAALLLKRYPDKKYFALLLPFGFFLIYGVITIIELNFRVFPIWIVAFIGSYLAVLINLVKPKLFYYAFIILISVVQIGIGGHIIYNWIYTWNSMEGESFAHYRFIRSHFTDFLNEEEFINLKTGEPYIFRPTSNKELVLIDFWTIGCGLCINNMNEINEMKKQGKLKNVEVISVLVSRSEDRRNFKSSIDNVIKDKDYLCLQTKDSSVLEKLAVSGVPFCVLYAGNYDVKFSGMPITEEKVRNNILNIIKQYQ